MKATLLFCLVCITTFAQSQLTTIKKGVQLSHVFSVDAITKITIQNSYTKTNYVLTKPELLLVKTQLNGAIATGGLGVKPGHLTIKIQLNAKDIIYSYAYPNEGQIHFENARYKGLIFDGSFTLQDKKFNFDRFKP